MNHYFEKGTGTNFLLLHGTGGDENSLVDLARFLDPKSTILSFRGRVQENGMNRFFKRNGLNQFDLPSLEEETDYLLKEIAAVSRQNGIPQEDWIVLGYSNGANIAGHFLLERETGLNKAILLHPMSLGVDTKSNSLKDKRIFLSYGAADPIVSSEAFQTLEAQLEKRGADLTVIKTSDGHQVTSDELDQIKKWLANLA